MQIRSFAGSRLGLGWPSASVVLANEPAQNQPQQSSSTCSLIAALKTTPAFALARHLQQFFNEAGCFEFVEGLDRLAKAILGQIFDLGLLQLVLVDDHKLEKAKVENLAQDRFGKTVKALNKLEASGLIEELLEMTGQSKGRSRFQGRYQRAGGR